MSTCGMNHCVCNKVKDIIIAQDNVVNDTCKTGCDQSIQDLLSPSTNKPAKNTTIPFILYCKDSCKPFFGTGVSQEPRRGGFDFDCIESPIFRAKKFDKNNECCVQLELLEPVRYQTPSSNDKTTWPPSSNDQSVCDSLTNARNLRATGLCITVDLNAFIGITCLDPITPLSSS